MSGKEIGMKENTFYEIRKNSFKEKLILPFYGGLSIANIANSVLKNFGGESGVQLNEPLRGLFENRDFIVLLLIDALGFNLISSIMDKTELPAFNKLKEKGMFAALTSVFPSTTAVALPSITSGLTPSEHGLLGYRFYSKKYGYLINSLFGKPANTERCKIKIDINWYMPKETVAEKLSDLHVNSYVVTRIDYLNSHFEKAIYRGFKEVPYLTMSDLFAHVSELLSEEPPVYINAYWWGIDGLSHRYGPYSKEVLNEVILLDKMIDGILRILPKNSLFIAISDHGQINSPFGRTVDLSSYREIADKIMLPVSDLRAPYVYTRGNVNKELFKTLGNISVLTNREAFELNLFGKGREFTDRVGDFVFLIEDDKNYAYLSPQEEINLIGKHGGLSEDEMLVPFFAYSV